MHQAQLGTHIELPEMEDLHEPRRSGDRCRGRAKEAEIRATFALPQPGSDAIAATCHGRRAQSLGGGSPAADRLADDFALDGLAYYYRGLDNGPFEQLAAGLIVGNSLLTARGIPTPARRSANVRRDAHHGPPRRRWLVHGFSMAMDFNDDILLMGHDGPGHLAISAAPPTLRGAGSLPRQAGGGLSVDSPSRPGQSRSSA